MLLGRSRLSLGCRAEQKCHNSLDRKGIRAEPRRPEASVLAAATWEELILCDRSEADSWGSGHCPNHWQFGSDGKQGSPERAVSRKKYSTVNICHKMTRGCTCTERCQNYKHATSSICCLQVSGCRLLWEQQNRKVILEVTVPNAPSLALLGSPSESVLTDEVLIDVRNVLDPEFKWRWECPHADRQEWFYWTYCTTIKRCYRAKHIWGQLRWFSNCFLFMMGRQGRFEVEENIDK